ncbi:MAG: hypothetical protein A4E52_01297 [Pelotomaculum sp. PtaB.Bin013]|uniref:Uncharacterized protein n=1 Tax=Pelotomaculum isophthalicicum JI TaxID=947010 RepID=A0A9X4GY50_9FIRM|nr:hypothetical protein [Pelotomaculum isophthalicicum]MDF9407432.1 hypothetical protein [Pelotomaculum isophthalicicum JI]OPX88108.1 MAG: hypothetical protein A4E52_01297 [Pelotomaculum sp. PtaB.Bin013]
MGVCYKGKNNDVNSSVGLLISILVCYPEVAAINFDPEKQLLRFTFMYSKVLIDNELNDLKARLLSSIEVYNLLEGKDNNVILLNSQICDNLTIIEVQRDVNTLVQEEITLIVELFRQYFNNNLVTEGYDYYIEEEIVAQEEMIGHMLERMKGTSQDKYLFAFREEGKVLVFDK